MAESQELEELMHHSVICVHDINRDIGSLSTGKCPTLQCEDSKTRGNCRNSKLCWNTSFENDAYKVFVGI